MFVPFAPKDNIEKTKFGTANFLHILEVRRNLLIWYGACFWHRGSSSGRCRAALADWSVSDRICGLATPASLVADHRPHK